MKTYWENDGKPNDGGDYVAVVDFEEKGKSNQRYIGKTEKEVSDKVLQALANASEKIRRQEKELKPVPLAAPVAGPKMLSADDRFEITHSLDDPAKAPEAIARAVEAQTGVPLKKIADRVREDEAKAEQQRAFEASSTFAREEERFLPCDFNANKMAAYLKAYGLSPFEVSNWHLAFRDLFENKLLIEKATEETQPVAAEGEQPAPATQPEAHPAGGLPAQGIRPRGAVGSTGVRGADYAPSAARQKPKYTKAEIEAMPTAKYDDLMRNDPSFAKMVNEVYAARPTAR